MYPNTNENIIKTKIYIFYYSYFSLHKTNNYTIINSPLFQGVTINLIFFVSLQFYEIILLKIDFNVLFYVKILNSEFL